jgi:arylsulfatase A-like enzyme
MLESVDEGVGQIMKTLERLKLDRNTIIVFTSDNGGETRVTLNGSLREGKSYLYEGGIRIPLIVSWPGVIAGGSTSPFPVITQDFFPTLIAVAGADLPNSQVCDGVNILPLLKGMKNLDRTNLYWHYPLPKPHFLGGTSAGAVRSGDYKLIEFFDTGILELYNLSDDEGEQRNLAAQFPEKATELRRILEAWRREVEAEEIPRVYEK